MQSTADTKEQVGRMDLRKHTSIRTKIILAVVVVSFVTVSLTTGLHIRTIYRNVLSESQVQTEALTIPVRQDLDTLWQQSSGQPDLRHLTKIGPNMRMLELLNNIVHWPGRKDLTVAYVVDEKGNILAEAGKTRAVNRLPVSVFESVIQGSQKTKTIHNEDRYDTFVPYRANGGEVAGYIVIGISAKSLWNQAWELASGAMISFSIISIFTVSMLAIWVSHYMVRPLEKISHSIVQGAKGGRLELGKLVESSNEIGHLARVTGEVLPELYRKQQELKLTGQQLALENSKLERTKRALMEMEQRYRAAVEAATGVAYELDLATGKFKFLSRQIYETVGFAAEDLPSSEVWTEHIHGDDRAQAQEILNACLKGKKSCFSRSYRFVCQDGHELLIAELGGVILDESGRPSRISGMVMPVHMLPKSILARG